MKNNNEKLFGIQKVKYQRLYENVLNQLYELMQNGKLLPGDTLPPEREAAKMFGVSRGTLREAFRILENEGIIESRPGGGRYIGNIDGYVNKKNLFDSFEKASIDKLYEVREILEMSIAELATKSATQEDIDDLEEALNRARKNKGKLLPYEQKFHVVLANATHNTLLVDTMRVYADLIEKNKQRKGDLYPDRESEVLKEHAEILEAVKERNAEKAKELMRRHLEKGRTFNLEDQN